MNEPLRLYFWNGETNFGDRLSAEVVSFVSGRSVEWAGPRKCDLFAVGSLSHVMRRSHKKARAEGEKPWVWGTGMLMIPAQTEFVANMRFAAVRGPLSQMHLGLPDLPHGDPGVLAADALGHRPERHDKVGIVLHYTRKLPEDVMAAIEASGRFEMIDVTDPDHMGVVARIGACAHVISSSLHGLVVADAFGVPNTWLDPEGIHAGLTALKFYDYGLGVGRAMEKPLPAAAIMEFVAGLPKVPGELPYAGGLAAAKDALVAAFPDELRAVAERKRA